MVYASIKFKMKDEFILGPYKEPLSKIEGGYGYLGAISLSNEGKIQCHICGKTFENLTFHIRTHDLKVKEYRIKFRLAKQSRLISEKERDRLKYVMFKIRDMVNWKEVSKKALAGRMKFLEKNPTKGKELLSLEHKNIRGTCPEQLLSIIRDCQKSYGYAPSYEEFILFTGTQRFFRPIKKTFGSWSNAVRKAGFEPKTELKGRTKGIKEIKYETEELLEYLQDFYRENNSIPSRTDFIRGLLPPFEHYLRRFGSIVEARRLAGIPEWQSQKGRRTDLLLK